MPRNATALDLKGGKKQSIAFGLVNVPVRIKNVNASAKSSGAPSANFICADHQEKCKTHRYCEAGDHTVDAVKAFPVEGGGYVTIDDDLLESIVAEKTGAINIDVFVPADEIDPAFYKASYIVAPDEGGAPTYDLLAKAIAETGMVGVGRAVLPGTKRTQLVALRWSPWAEQLMAESLKFDTEIDYANVDAVANGIKSRPAPAAANVKMATQIIEGLAGDFDPTVVEDDFAAGVRDLIAQAAAGKKLVAPKPKAAAPPADDLAAQLVKSIAAAKAGGKKPAKKTKAAA